MKVPSVPPVMVMSVAANPVTASEKTNSAVKAVTELILGGTSLIVRAGAVASQMAVAVTSEAGPVSPSTSAAASAATVTTTSLEPSGVTASV